MLFAYQPRVLAFVVHVLPSKLALLKQSLIAVATSLEDDDRVYMYSPGNFTVHNRRGPVVGQLANFVPKEPFRLDRALQQTLRLIQREDPTSDRYIYVILDQYSSQEEYFAQKAFRLEQKEDCNCTFILCNLEKCDALQQLTPYHPRCHYLHITDFSTITEQLQAMCKVPDQPELDEEFKSQYGKTPQEARIEIQEKYAQNLPIPSVEKDGSGAS